jgi:hypothetical protein
MRLRPMTDENRLFERAFNIRPTFRLIRRDIVPHLHDITRYYNTYEDGVGGSYVTEVRPVVTIEFVAVPERRRLYRGA